MAPPASARSRPACRAWFILLLAALVVGTGVIWLRTPRFPQESSATVPSPPPVRGAAGGLLAREAAFARIARHENEPAPPLPAGQNAADLYKNAFALFDQLTAEEKEVFRNRTKAVDPAKADALFAKIQPILELLRRAGTMTECDWALGPIGPDTPMPHLGKAMELARLVQWGAVYQFPTNPDAAIDDLMAITQLGRQVSSAVIGLLIEKAIDDIALDPVRANLSTLSDAAMTRVADLLASSTTEGWIHRAFEAEMDFVRSTAAKLRDSAEGREMMLNEILAVNSDDSSADAVRRLAEDPAALAAELDYIVAIQGQMADAMLWPEARFRSWWNGIEESLKGGQHPLAQVTLPTLSTVYSRVQSARIQTEMLSAALTIMQNGPDGLADFRDPATEQPFTLVEKPGGFELQSAFLVRKKPFTMFFPTAAPAVTVP